MPNTIFQKLSVNGSKSKYLQFLKKKTNNILSTSLH